MTFSVLLPTHNRLALLRNAVETVRRQDEQDWEIVVSDNSSTDDVAGYVAKMDDPRIRYIRTPRFLPVTESWNYALDAARGDYIVMLGDDDGLLPGYFRGLGEVIEGHGRPDLVYHSALLFAYPGVIPDRPDGFLQDYTGTGFVRFASGPYPLAPEDARALVRKAMRFQMAFGYNMQFSLVSRELVQRIQLTGPFFQSQFPDYYATMSMLLEARSIIVDPRPHVIIGISPKSYGFFHFNRREEEGKHFLNAAVDGEDCATRSLELPGSHMNTGWLDAVLALERSYGEQYGLRVIRWRYRFVQTTATYLGRYVGGTASVTDLRDLQARLSWAERVTADLGMMIYGIARRLLGVLRAVRMRPPMTKTHELLGQSPAWAGERAVSMCRDVLDVFRAVQSGPRDDPLKAASSARRAA